MSKFQYVQYYFWIKILDIPDSYGFLYGLDYKGNIESVLYNNSLKGSNLIGCKLSVIRV